MSGGYPSAQELMDTASARSGLDDFGKPTFLEGLESLLDSLAADVAYGAEHRQRVIDLLLRRLTNRLEIEAWFAEHPEAEVAPIETPVSIVGLPRTGTTALGNMMSRDVQFRPLRPWEQEEPCPPPRIENEAHDERRVAYRERIETMLRDQPEQAAMHVWEVDATMEDTEILGLEFRAQQMTMPVWRYHAWWRSGDMRAAYRYHARVARLLQSERPPNRWLFKAPHHTFHLRHILEGYPDMRFVFTHRDPAKAVPSYASFVASLFPPNVLAQIGKETIGRKIHEHLLESMNQAMAAREKLGPDRFIDVHHTDFVNNPIEEFERVYGWLGLKLSDTTRAAFERWRVEHAPGTHGAHHYTAADYGLSVEEIREDFDAYIRAFDVEVGSARGSA